MSGSPRLRPRRRPPAAFNPPVAERREPSLLQKPNGSWFVRFRHAGRTKDRALGLSSRVLRGEEGPPPGKERGYTNDGGRWVPKDVHDRYATDHRAPYLRGAVNPWDDAPVPLLRDAVVEFLAAYEAGGATHRNYASILRRLGEAVGDPHVRLDRVTSRDVEAIVDAPRLSAASRQSYRRHLRAFFNWAADRGYVRAENPVDVLPEPRRDAVAPFVYCGADDFERVLAELYRDHEAKRKWLHRTEELLWVEPVFELALMTGLRRSELAQLQWQDVDFEKGTVEVREKGAARDGVAFIPKGRRSRRVELFPRAERVLRGLAEGRGEVGPRDFVLLSPEVRPDGARLPANAEKASKRWRGYREAAGLPRELKLHGLRHTFVTNLLLLGHEPYFVMAQAGHTDFKVTMGYAHFADALVSRRVLGPFRDRLVEFGFARPHTDR